MPKTGFLFFIKAILTEKTRKIGSLIVAEAVAMRLLIMNTRVLLQRIVQPVA